MRQRIDDDIRPKLRIKRMGEVTYFTTAVITEDAPFAARLVHPCRRRQLLTVNDVLSAVLPRHFETLSTVRRILQIRRQPFRVFQNTEANRRILKTRRTAESVSKWRVKMVERTSSTAKSRRCRHGLMSLVANGVCSVITEAVK